MKVPFVCLKSQYASIKADIDSAVASVITDTAFVGGPYLTRFEKDFAAYCQVSHAVGCSNGTDALRLALHAVGVGPGDEVITAPNTFIATAEAITMVGAQVRFVDVDPDTQNLDPALLPAAITKRTRAIIPVHLYGRPADMHPIMNIAKAGDLKVIGDAAQAHGAMYQGRPIGALGDAVCFSFYPGKNLGAYGDAGAVVTNDPAVAAKVALMRDHGRTQKYIHDVAGFNCRMDALQGAILSAKLPHLAEWTDRRRSRAALYSQLLSGLPGVAVPAPEGSSEMVYHLYVIQHADRDALQARLNALGVSTGVHYPVPLHLQPAYAHLSYAKGSFPVCESLADRILSLPMFAELTDEQVHAVADAVRLACAAPLGAQAQDSASL